MTEDDGLAVRTAGLTKRFRSGQVAVDGIDLAVPRGAVYGFLGPNGSGKTTTIRMLLGLARPTAGRAWLLGAAIPEESVRVLPRVGALVEGPAFHPYLSGRANLARLDAGDATADPRTSRQRAERALDRVGLSAAAAKPYRQYSLGMKQRLGLAAALLQPRDLLVLDEPTNGLDPQGTREVRHLVRELAEGGATVLVSSHLLAEIEQVCTHVGIMSRGHLLLQGERAALTDRGAARLVVTTRAAQAGAAADVLTGLGLTEVEPPPPALGDGPVTLTAALGPTPPEKVSAALVHAGIDLVGFEVARPNLEQVFVELTGEGFDVAR
ncbi:ABC transporter ATP-binding protein [Cellulomonas hominis]|uniref:ABC transporter ATP-binding protein n=1 Tax=Cellulomonas hominis TaxID=156981 RepID=UPI001B951B9B|nr:ABC transporter ATP-binding protein [Cellulomonas hominis]VTR78340.1 Daunorubicin/doxorubicin resistance ATP-binding protein DrrA [Cellulomonas hominis]